MRFIDNNGSQAKGRRQYSGHENIQTTDVQNPTRLLTIIKNFLTRLSRVESERPPDSVEFEVDYTTSGAPTVIFNHGISGPVRWYITSLQVASPPAATPALVSFATSFDIDGQTSLRWSASATVTGRAVVRFESSQFGTRRPV